MSDETQQPTTADAESSGVSKPESTSPEATLDKVSEPSSGPSQDFQSTGQASIPPSSSESTLATPDEVGGAWEGPEGAVPVKDQNSANEPLEKQREENLKLANQTRQDKKRKKIDEIINLFLEKREPGRHDTTISNDEVEKLLHVSDATATRYLETLEKEGKIKQIGKTGKGVRYERV